MSVGIDETGDAGSDDWAEFMLIADTDNSSKNAEMFVDSTDDDVMSESIALVQESETQTNLFETHEVQQW